MNFQAERFLYRNRLPVLYGCIAAIAICLVMAVVFPTSASKWINSAGLIGDITGLLQLEISGFFDDLAKLAMTYEEQEANIPSSLVREIIDMPDEDKTTRDRFEEWLKRSPKAGASFIVLGCALQLLGTWL